MLVTVMLVGRLPGAGFFYWSEEVVDFILLIATAQSSEIPTVTSQYDEKTVEQLISCW